MQNYEPLEEHRLALISCSVVVVFCTIKMGGKYREGGRYMKKV